MAFISGVGLRFLLIMLIVIQGQKCSNGAAISSCCADTSTAVIRRPVTACYEQRPNDDAFCNIHAYIMITDDKMQWCVDPKADWLPRRLSRLRRRNIICTATI